MIHELMKYFWLFAIGAVIVILLIKKITRKTTINILLKILLGIAITVFILAVSGLIEFYLFGEEMFLIIYPFTFLELPILYSVITTFKELSETIRLHKHGCCTIGMVIDIESGKGHYYKIQYHVNDQKYVCTITGMTQAIQWERGSEATVIYSKDDPQKSCLQKYDLILSIILSIVSALLLIGIIAVECVIVTATL